MAGIKKLLFTLTFLLIFAPLAGPAQGWQFSMTGAMYWAYELYSQGGTKAFLGRTISTTERARAQRI